MRKVKGKESFALFVSPRVWKGVDDHGLKSSRLVWAKGMINTPTYILRTLLLEPFTTRTKCSLVFTDGSKSQYGNGVLFLFPTIPVPITKRVPCLCDWAISLCFQKASFLLIFILCNSQNSLSLLCSLYSIHPLVCEIQEWLFRLYAHKKSVLGSVPCWYYQQWTCQHWNILLLY